MNFAGIKNIHHKTIHEILSGTNVVDKWLYRWRWHWILCLLVLAFFTRYSRLSYYWVNGADQGRYLALADNIRQGRLSWSNSYDMLANFQNGFTNFTPPLYPALTGLVGIMTGDVEVSGTIVNTACGLLAIMFAVLIAQRLTNSLVAFLVGLAVAGHPYFVNFSTNRYLEMSYTAVFLAGLFMTFCAIDKPTRGRMVATGLLWAIAALGRFEGTTLFILVFLYLLSRLRSRKVLFVLAGFFLIMAPFRVWKAVGTPDNPPQVNNLMFNLVVCRMGDALKAYWKIDDQGELISINETREASPVPYLWKERSFFWRHVTNNLKRMPRIFYKDVLWSGLWLFVLLGMAVLIISDRPGYEWRFIALLSIVPVFLFSFTCLQPRYFLSLLPLYFLFAAFFLVYLFETLSRGLRKIIHYPVLINIVFSCIIFIIAGVYGYFAFQPRIYYNARAGALPAGRMKILAGILREMPERPKLAASINPGFNWMARTTQIFIPYTSPELALRFLRSRGTAYIFVDRPFFRRNLPILSKLTHPEEISDELELIARDPNNWYYLYRIRKEPLPGSPGFREALETYIQAAQSFHDKEFVKKERARAEKQLNPTN